MYPQHPISPSCSYCACCPVAEIQLPQNVHVARSNSYFHILGQHKILHNACLISDNSTQPVYLQSTMLYFKFPWNYIAYTCIISSNKSTYIRLVYMQSNNIVKSKPFYDEAIENYGGWDFMKRYQEICNGQHSASLLLIWGITCVSTLVSQLSVSCL